MVESILCGIYLERLPTLCDHNFTRAVVCRRVQAADRARNQWLAVGFDPESVILMGTLGNLSHKLPTQLL